MGGVGSKSPGSNVSVSFPAFSPTVNFLNAFKLSWILNVDVLPVDSVRVFVGNPSAVSG